MEVFCMSNLNNKDESWWWKNILSGVILIYIIMVILAPLVPEKGKNDESWFPGRLETQDIVLVGLALIFNSGIVERLKKLELSATNIVAELNEAKEEVRVAKEEADKIQEIVARLPPESTNNKTEANHELENLKNALNSSEQRIQRLQKIIR